MKAEETWFVIEEYEHSSWRGEYSVVHVLEWVGGGWCIGAVYSRISVSEHELVGEWHKHQHTRTGPIDPAQLRSEEFRRIVEMYDSLWKVEAVFEDEQRRRTRRADYDRAEYASRKAKREAKCAEVRQAPLKWWQQLWQAVRTWKHPLIR